MGVTSMVRRASAVVCPRTNYYDVGCCIKSVSIFVLLSASKVDLCLKKVGDPSSKQYSGIRETITHYLAKDRILCVFITDLSL